MGTQCKEYQVKWFFDYKTKICTQVWYGGCNGNANRFETEADCISRCVKPCKYPNRINPFCTFNIVKQSFQAERKNSLNTNSTHFFSTADEEDMQLPVLEKSHLSGKVRNGEDCTSDYLS